MLTLIINLERATERREAISKRLNELGVPFELFTATDGRVLTETDMAVVDHAKRHFYSPYPLTPYELACGLSHRRALQYMVEKNVPMAAIIEDDGILDADLPAVLKAIEGRSDSFDFIFLHTPLKRQKPRPFVALEKLGPNNALGRVKYMSMRTTGYVASRRGAEKLLRMTETFTHAIDMTMHRYWENGLDIYALQKPVVAQDDDAPSFINPAPGNRPKNPPYPDADSLYWRFMRTAVKVMASVQKRLVFHTRLT